LDITFVNFGTMLQKSKLDLNSVNKKFESILMRSTTASMLPSREYQKHAISVSTTCNNINVF